MIGAVTPGTQGSIGGVSGQSGPNQITAGVTLKDRPITWYWWFGGQSQRII